jgi:hypothetical protein
VEERVNLRAIREVNTGFGDGLAGAFELVATPAIFAYLGHLLDGRLGTGMVFMLGFAIFVFGYECWKLVSKYNAEMDRHEANAPWNRHKLGTAAAQESTGREGA